MGEAKRRKERLGLRYGKPLGLSSAKRIELIDSNIAQWILEHFNNCGYHNYLEKPLNPQTRTNQLDESNLESVIENVSEHFSMTFNQNYPNASIKLLIKAIVKERPIVFQGVNSKSRRRMEPTVALPEEPKILSFTT